ncbi:unnamed protein product, partial [Allacma fusca]
FNCDMCTSTLGVMSQLNLEVNYIEMKVSELARCLPETCLENARKAFDNFSYSDWDLVSRSDLIGSKSFTDNPFISQSPRTLQEIMSEFLIGIPTIRSIRLIYLPEIYLSTSGKDSFETTQEIRIPHFTSFNFITSDSLKSVKIGFRLYFIPFDAFIWGCTLSSILLMTLLVHRFGTMSQNLVLVAVSVLGNLVEQGSKALNTSKCKKSNTNMILVPIWLLSGIIISNGYKGVLNMVYVADNEIRTEWKYLHEMSNFTLYLPLDINYLSFIFNCYISRTNLCVKYCWSSGSDVFYGNTEFDVILTKNRSRHLTPQQFHCLNQNNFAESVQQKLTIEKTALVVYSHQLNFYWKEVEKVMRRKGLKFAHNGKTLNDPTLGQPHSIYASHSFLEKYDYAGKRAKIAVSSGLFLLWKKWHQIWNQRKFLDLRTKDSNEVVVRPLSLNSSFSLAFFALLWGLFICIIVFAAEITTRRML